MAETTSREELEKLFSEKESLFKRNEYYNLLQRKRGDCAFPEVVLMAVR